MLVVGIFAFLGDDVGKFSLQLLSGLQSHLSGYGGEILIWIKESQHYT